MKKFGNFSNMLETTQECILSIRKPLQTPKIQFFSKFGFFRVSHTPDFAFLGSFWAYKIKNLRRKWPRSDEKMKKIWKFFKHARNSPRMLFEHPRATTNSKKSIFSKFGFFRVSHTQDFAFLGSSWAVSYTHLTLPTNSRV